ncbi:11792_t:CDS:2, partial [Acaulospora colombiana]
MKFLANPADSIPMKHKQQSKVAPCVHGAESALRYTVWDDSMSIQSRQFDGIRGLILTNHEAKALMEHLKLVIRNTYPTRHR